MARKDNHSGGGERRLSTRRGPRRRGPASPGEAARTLQAKQGPLRDRRPALVRLRTERRPRPCWSSMKRPRFRRGRLRTWSTHCGRGRLPDPAELTATSGRRSTPAAPSPSSSTGSGWWARPATNRQQDPSRREPPRSSARPCPRRGLRQDIQTSSPLGERSTLRTNVAGLTRAEISALISGHWLVGAR